MRPSAALWSTVLLLAAAAACAATDRKLQAAANPAVMNGHDAHKRYDWFTKISFEWPSPDDPAVVWGTSCGGMLIDSTTVLTAAHCVFKEVGSLMPLGVARIGIYAQDEDASLYETITMALIIPHPNYDHQQGGAGGWDVAIIKLAAPSTKTPVALAPYTPKPNLPVPAGTILQTIGFGVLQDEPALENPFPNTLQETALQLRSLEYCNTDNVSPNPYLSPNNTEVCTTPPGATTPPFWTDVCHGDSGGPLFQSGADPSQPDVLYAIVSHGPDCNKETGLRGPGYWTDVAQLRCWIETTGGLPVSDACKPKPACVVPNCARCNPLNFVKCALCKDGFKLNRWGACVPKTCLDYDRWCHRCSPWKPLRCHSCKSRWYKVDARTGRCHKRRYL